jgi:hypothetical protein
MSVRMKQRAMAISRMYHRPASSREAARTDSAQLITACSLERLKQMPAGLWYILLIAIALCFVLTLIHNARKDRPCGVTPAAHGRILHLLLSAEH